MKRPTRKRVPTRKMKTKTENSLLKRSIRKSSQRWTPFDPKTLACTIRTSNFIQKWQNLKFPVLKKRRQKSRCTFAIIIDRICWMVLLRRKLMIPQRHLRRSRRILRKISSRKCKTLPTRQARMKKKMEISWLPNPNRTLAKPLRKSPRSSLTLRMLIKILKHSCQISFLLGPGYRQRSPNSSHLNQMMKKRRREQRNLKKHTTSDLRIPTNSMKSSWHMLVTRQINSLFVEMKLVAARRSEMRSVKRKKPSAGKEKIRRTDFANWKWKN